MTGVSFARMNVLDALLTLRDVINLLDSAGLVVVGADGHADLVATPPQLEALAPKIEALLKDHGVDIPEAVDRILAALPLLLSLAGLH